ncbi:MAG: hypothetical protein KIS67_05365 [Verrucomicrobiae bacterium]|nr:hypothetical protein [Verrucomicrobiae bacterium]
MLTNVPPSSTASIYASEVNCDPLIRVVDQRRSRAILERRLPFHTQKAASKVLLKRHASTYRFHHPSPPPDT